MKWIKHERILEINRASGISIPQRVRSWECSNCHLLHTESEERPNRPVGGCWGCGQRDEEFGVDAPATGPTGREVLGRVVTDVDELREREARAASEEER